MHSPIAECGFIFNLTICNFKIFLSKMNSILSPFFYNIWLWIPLYFSSLIPFGGGSLFEYILLPTILITFVFEKILKLDREKLQRPTYFNKELYIAKDDSIIRIN